MSSLFAARAVAVTFVLLWLGYPASANEPTDEAKAYWNFSVTLQIVSYKPGKPESSRTHTTGSASVGGTVSLGAGVVDGKNLSVTFKPRRDDNQLRLTAVIAEEGEATGERDFDLSDLKPVTFDLAKSKAGRHYFASITPSYNKVSTSSKPYSAEALKLDAWQFRNSIVLLNDSLYVGRLGGGGRIAEISISDIATIEFSLLEVEGWKPWGLLNKGVLTITHPEHKTTIEIADCKNGASNAPIVLPGGPYQVWVDWRDAEVSSEQMREKLKEVRRQIVDKEIVTHEHAIHLIDKQLAREPGPWIYSSGYSSRSVSKAASKR